MEKSNDRFMNDERCKILFRTLEILLRDYMSLLQAVSVFAKAQDKIKKHQEITQEVVRFLADINGVSYEEDEGKVNGIARQGQATPEDEDRDDDEQGEPQ